MPHTITNNEGRPCEVRDKPLHEERVCEVRDIPILNERRTLKVRDRLLYHGGRTSEECGKPLINDIRGRLLNNERRT